MLFFRSSSSKSSSRGPSPVPEPVMWSMDISRSMVPRSAAPSRVSSSSKSSSLRWSWRGEWCCNPLVEGFFNESAGAGDEGGGGRVGGYVAAGVEVGELVLGCGVWGSASRIFSWTTGSVWSCATCSSGLGVMLCVGCGGGSLQWLRRLAGLLGFAGFPRLRGRLLLRELLLFRERRGFQGASRTDALWRNSLTATGSKR